MNALSTIASVLAEGTFQLEPDQWLHIPLEEQRELRLWQAAHQTEVTAVLVQHPMQRTEAEEDAALTALLRLGAETRWTAGLCGGLDEEGCECITGTLNDPSNIGDVEAALQHMLERLIAMSSPKRLAGHPTFAWSQQP